jgi:peptidoglycan/LPS O-acetylase OafA/YrhL
MQFYFVFPLVMASLFRVTQRRGIIATMMLIAAALGCTYSECLVRTDTSAAYFRLSSRFWEIMLGSVITLYDGHRVCTAVFSETQLLIVKSMVGIAGISILYFRVYFSPKRHHFQA